jgi:hypothetical protein
LKEKKAIGVTEVPDPPYYAQLRLMWRFWCKALGEKASEHNHEADLVALFRTLILASYFITNVFIVAGVVRHWNDSQKSTSEISSKF